MARYSSEHMLLQWSGLFANSTGSQTTDGFVGSLRFLGPGLASADTQEVCDNMAAALKAWWLSGTDNFIPYTARLTGVKWNRIGQDGRYVNKTATRYTWYTPDVVTANAVQYPQQVAWAATWNTNLARGRGHEGRTFFPTNIGLDPEIGMRVTPANCLKFANKCMNLISRLNVAASSGGTTFDPTAPTDPGGTPSQDIALRAVIMSSSGEGVGYINRCRVGNRLDIQRRRDNSTEEKYESTAVA